MTRAIRQQDEDRKRQIKRCFLALGREVRRGRGNHKRAEELLEQLQRLCGGNLEVVVERWGEFLQETTSAKPGSARGLKALVTVFEVIRLGKEAEAARLMAPTSNRERQTEPVRKACRREEPPDFSSWSDEELVAFIDAYQKEHAPKESRVRRDDEHAQNGVFVRGKGRHGPRSGPSRV